MVAHRVYAFRPNMAVAGVDANTVGVELDRIRGRAGVLTPTIVVDEASDVNHPLHPAFEWNDELAARQHRLTQARRLIVSIRVISSGPEQANVPVYLSIRTREHGMEYRPTVEVVRDEKLRERFLDELVQFTQSLERRYGSIMALADLMAEVRGLAANR